ncbi:MAG: flagellar hook-basal body complex protein FliE [Alkalispirochaetaceae bacterium]
MSDMFNGTGFQQSFLSPEQARGDQFVLARSHPSHRTARNEAAGTTGSTNFSDALFNSLDTVNDAQQEHERLTVQSIVAPESVDPHDLTVASAQANMTLNITRNVVDRVIQAYRSITTLR